jgi:DNA-binding SARP family transcriptional activator/TolB-like protein/Flp pilus assembly protein TadD
LRHNDFTSRSGDSGAPAAGPAFRLVTLGRLALVTAADGREVPGSQRRKLALLAFLALARRPVGRETLVDLFWSEENERGRHSLSNALSYLRRVLGPASIAIRRSEVSLAPETSIEVDARELLAAAKSGDHGRVVDLYGGSFLDGLYLPDSESFEEWVSAERARIDIAFSRACDLECMATARRGEWERCAEIARRWLAHEPMAPEAALHLLNSLRAARTPAGRTAALAEYQRLTDRLAREYQTTPDAKVVALAGQIAAKVNQDRASVVDAVTDDAAAAPADPLPVLQPVREPAETNTVVTIAIPDKPDVSRAANAPAQSAIQLPASRRTWPMRAAVAALAAIAVVGTLAYVSLHRASAALVTASRPLVVVTDIANLRGDTASDWLQDGLVQMISADLERSPDIEVITPGRVRDTRERARLTTTGPLTQDGALKLAQRLGATLIVRGGFTHGDGTYVLDVDLRDVATATSVRSFTLSGPEPMALADQAAGRILAWSTASDERPRFAEIETANMGAYQHFVRGLQADAEGRYADSRREWDAAIALDSGFGSALSMRLSRAKDDGDVRTIAQLEAAMRRARFSPWDILRSGIDSAQHDGEMARAEQLARAFVARYPHDPRSYYALATFYDLRGDWRDAERTLGQQLALDSLAIEAGSGPCVPCSVYHTLAQSRLNRGDLEGAEDAARRWIRLQPDLPGSWAELASALAYSGRFDASLDAERRALMLSGNDPLYALRTARTLLTARHLDAADSLARSWRNARDINLREGATDIHILALRERGQLRASVREAQAYLASNTYDDAIALEEIDALGRLGDHAAARSAFDLVVGNSEDAREAPTMLRGDRARWFTWTRALEANAIADAGDTLSLRAIADSMRLLSARSYYGRDPRLYHHVLGRIAMLGHRYAEAEREFQAARWGIAGWTETVAWLARAQLAQQHNDAAVATLRQAYMAPMDAMGRYQPRSELDYLMATAFAAAGEHDSAAVYSAHVRRAWRDADPELRNLLATLPR